MKNKQTAIQLLRESIDSEMKLGTKMVINWDMYLNIEREQIIKACDSNFTYGDYGYPTMGEQYYNETYNER